MVRLGERSPYLRVVQLAGNLYDVEVIALDRG